ncbi:rhomboid family intramembrane serine protease [Dyella solisilvae]|uniref:Rhomboid family intramembrane serine protease n=1 Tax=Dyella solisilvae TaxID=1920168 RepID=A0A370KCV2_9GAMM|nr:rhomboid family intramembrane serine protease [Dyella solisilvae]RDJ00459.1 rhomboid family intramembrane serine protease [Dyella solisilvae]
MSHEQAAPQRGGGSVGVLELGPAGDRPPTTAFAVMFGQQVGLNKVPTDDSRWAGKGQIRFDENTVTLSGPRKRPFLTSVQESRTFQRQEILNAAVTGSTVKFQRRVPGESMQTVRFTASNPAQALAILAHLPGEQTAEFASSQAALVDFQQRLDRLSPRAPVTPVLVALNVIVFIVACVAGMNPISPTGESAVQVGSNFGPLTMGGQWWRLFTATFIHFGIIHLALNMLALYQNGRTIERLFGSSRFLLLYVFAGLAGSLASLLWNPMVNGAGASGAIFGIFGGLLAFVINPHNAVPKEVMAEHRNSTLLFAGYSLFYGFAHSGIDNAAHLGGLVGGFAMGLLLARPLNTEHRSQAGLPRLLLSILLGAGALLAMAWPLVHPSGQAQQIARFERNLMEFSEHEKAILAQAKGLIEQVRGGSLSSAAFAAAFASQITPQWDALHEEFAAETIPPDHRDYALHQALLHYTDARRLEARALAKAATSIDPADSTALGTARGNTAAAMDEIKSAVAKRK